MFKTLRSALLAAFVGIVLLTLIIVVVLAVPRVRGAVINQISSGLFKQMYLVENEYQKLLQIKTSSAFIQKKALASSKQSRSRVTIIRKDGIVLGDSATPFEKLGELENHADRPEVLEAVKAGQGVSVRHSVTTGLDLIYVAIPLRGANNQILGYLRFSVPSEYAVILAWKIIKSMAIAFIIAVVVAILLSMVFARGFTHPITHLSKVANDIAGGKFPVTIVRRSKFEVGKLEEAVEGMSQRLAETFNTLAVKRGQISTMISSMNEGVLAVDNKGKIILANPYVEKIFAVNEPAIIGLTTRAGIRNNEVADLIDSVLQSKQIYKRGIEISGPPRRSLIANASPVIKEDGVLLGTVCVLYDITEIKRLENYRQEFVANVSHELKTPLTAIRNYVETLLGGAIDDTKRNRDFLKKIEKHAVNLSDLIEDILEISKLETKNDLEPFRDVDVTSIARRAVETLSAKAKKKGIEVSLIACAATCFVTGSEDHIYRALLNLLSNAINYTPHGGRVEISCQLANDTFTVSVKDTGVGIGKNHLLRIFERFYRVDQARSKDLGGTGLGLSIVKHVMNIHKGKVLVESEEGKGSTFTLVFPV